LLELVEPLETPFDMKRQGKVEKEVEENLGNEVLIIEAIWNNEVGPTFDNLVSLNLCECNIGDKGTTFLSEILKKQTPLLKYINLQANNITEQGAYFLSEVVSNNHTILSLDLGKNNITCSGISHLSKALKNNSVLQTLNLFQNFISDDGAMSISSLLLENGFLRCLNLKNNVIGNSGALEIAKSLHGNTSLRELYLEHNFLFDQAAFSMGDMLRKNSGLTVLDIADNYITEAAVPILADALIKNKLLHVLNLKMNNSISNSKVVLCFVDVLITNSSLTDIGLPSSYNILTTEVMAFRKELAWNQMFQEALKWPQFNEKLPEEMKVGITEFFLVTGKELVKIPVEVMYEIVKLIVILWPRGLNSSVEISREILFMDAW